MKKTNARHYSKLYIPFVLVVIVFIGFSLWLDKSYDKLQADWLSRNPDVVYPEQMREDFRTVIKEVGYFKAAEDTLKVTGGFEKWFSLTGYKDSIGPNLTFKPSDACIVFDKFFSEQDVKGILEDLDKIGFTPDRYSPSREEIIKDLSGEKTETTHELAPSHNFERGDRNLRLITPFKKNSEMTTGFACLSEK